MLLFQRRFLPLLRNGTKTQTIRLWSRPRVKPGQLAYVPGLHKNPARSRLLILSLTPLKSLRSLTPADARADGFKSLRALLTEIRRLYPSPKNRQLFRIRFSYRNSGRKPGADSPPPSRPKPAADSPNFRRKPESPSPPPTQNSELRTPNSVSALRRQLARFLQLPTAH